MQIKTFSVTLAETFMLSSKVRHFVFEAEQVPPFHYAPGQFITIHFERNGKMLKRSYSIANVPAEDNRIEFAAGFVEGGPGTELLFNLKIGDKLNLSGPFGRLILKEEMPKRYILVATSTGVTPYRAMLSELRRRLQVNPDLKIVILQGVQKHEEILYPDEFLAFAKEFPQVTFRAHLSREATDHFQPHEHQGYVQHSFPDLSLDPANDVVYLCGNPGMIDDSFNYLKERGFSMQQVIREKYISAPGK
ncbi:ferredoxin--NADP reductase [Legionella jordanis]|nr:ferredoxin--NADP reductase [Legionella jordanis]RMX01927.1 ferredoxin--NADP reductase [Legionella jordanis]RMX17734.1 ferredoxin--NADP reductase [Legionella jordanis]HAT8714688.1 ferredoxin--NADP reductase [Legionella jordanis]